MRAVIGTAGHVDHGKSSLIQALTGIHPSHLPQELKQEITIDLGFAHFSTPSGDKIGVIDVPGHERFIRNMVSAVWGLDMALFVVAADEGWAALSMEHLRIIAAMGIKECILVISKCDLATQDRLAEVEDQSLEHFLEEMNILPDVVHVSARSGEGIETLKQLILKKIANLKERENLDTAAHLYVDRVFSVNGVGTTVTGTLRGDKLVNGETLTLFPGGQTVKIKSLQGYHKQLEEALPYARTAIALKQVNKKQVSRGSCLVANPEAISLSKDWILQLSPHFSQNLKKQSIVEIALGTSHVQAKCFVYAGKQLARIQLEESIPIFWGQPILIIQHGGSQIIGSGRLAWTQPLDKKQRKILQDTLSELEIQTTNITTKVSLQLALNGYAKKLKNIGPSEQIEEIDEWWIKKEHLTTLLKDCNVFLEKEIHTINIEDLARHTGYPSSLIKNIAETECEAGRWEKIDGGLVSAQGHNSNVLPKEQQQLLEEIQEAGSAGYDISKSSIVGVRKLLRALTEKRLVVPTEDDLFFSQSAYEDLIKHIMAGLNKGELFNVASARERTDLSRKQLIPLFNRLEKDGWVKRVGNDRQVCRVYGET